jgi:hypothetical protein
LKPRRSSVIFEVRLGQGSVGLRQYSSEQGREIVKVRLSAIVAVVLLSLSLAGSAFAFDCIRVSSSLHGLQQSTTSGKWLLFDLSSPTAVAAALAANGIPADAAGAACVYQSYAASGMPLYFAIGTGVAGGFTNGPGVLAHNNPNTNVLSNGKGIDHLDDSGIFPALFTAVFDCTGIEITG